MKNKLAYILSAAVLSLAMAGCQKLDEPVLGNYPKDNNPPDGPLKFYAAFDGTSSNPLMNAVDSIKANFPSVNEFTTTEGIKGKGVTGVAQKFIKYPSFNSWASSSSFTIAVWFKKNGQTKNNTGTNGTEYILSLKASDGFHWSNAVGFIFLEGNNTKCAIKSMFVSSFNASNPSSTDPADNWFTWEGDQTIAGICDDKWHHLALTYDETTSSMKLFIDGLQNQNVKTWNQGNTGHGALRLYTSKINEYRVGAGPSGNVASDDWLAGSMKGSMDQLRLYGKVLSAVEIKSLYDNRL